MTFEPRSWLFVPADSEKKIAKAIDERGRCGHLRPRGQRRPRAKGRRARHHPEGPRQAAPAARNGGCASTRSRTDEHHKATSRCSAIAGIHGVVLPKAEGGADIAELAHRTGNIPIHAIVTETAASLFGLLSYRDPKSPLAAMSWGAEDLSAALGASSKYDADGSLSYTYRLARSLCLAGAVAAGVQPIDGVFADFRDDEGLRAEAEAAAREGFTGKLAIHPAQVARDQCRLHPLGRRSRRTPRYRRSIRRRAQRGVLSVGGRMVDRPHLVQARGYSTRAISGGRHGDDA